MKKYDVVIVGLGPTGGTLANLLALNGFSILILEREKSLYSLPRAVHFDDEIMRVFQTIGITKKFLKDTIVNKGTKFVNPEGKILLDWPRPRIITENGWYPSYRFHQPDLERNLRIRLRKFKKVSIRQNSDVCKIESTKNKVNLVFKDMMNHKLHNVSSKYVIGCDGARSITRTQMGTELDNLGFTQKWVVVDLILKQKKDELPDRTIQYSNLKRPATYCRNVGKRRRWEFAIHDDEDEQELLSDNYIWNFLKPWLSPKEAHLERKTIYTFQSAIARKWRKGRIFIAGDAAHLMPPFMGQGMCAGIRDASNLAWKISLCVKNKHNEDFLDTYQTERFSNAREYIETTMRMGEFVNAIGSDKITNNISSKPDGTKKMESIKPKLGFGLGDKTDRNRGKIFPQLKMKNGKTLDDKFSTSPLVLLSSELKKQKSKSKIPIITEKEVVGLSNVLKSYEAKAVIVRPDRFILKTCKTTKDFNQIEHLPL